MKNNYMIKLAAVLLVAVMITTGAVSGTFAKYTSSATGFASARVARWAFDVNGTNIVRNHTMTFNLFATIYDTENGLAEDETDVAEGVTNAIIAPGTWGYFDIELTNTSEVAAKYVIEFSQILTNAAPEGLNIMFMKHTGDNLPSASNLGWTDVIHNWSVQETPIAIGETDTIRMFWKWEYENGKDNAETLMGIAAAGGETIPTIQIKATITATQVD